MSKRRREADNEESSTLGGVELSESETDSDSASEESVSGTTSVSSAPDATSTFRRKYNRLMDTCRKLEKREGFSGDIQEIMTKHIKSAKTLFHELSHDTNAPSTSRGSSTPRNAVESLGTAPGDIYMAFMHTKMISDVLRSKTDSIGTCNSGFKMEEFMNSLKRQSKIQEIYSPKLASKILSLECAAASTTLPLLAAVVGSFDRDAISVPKEKKQRAQIVKKKFDDIEKTQEEVQNFNSKPTGPQKLAHHLNRVLRQHTRSQSRPTTLYEFIFDPSSINKSIESIFYVAFLVHDGVAGLHRSAGSELKDLAIELKPEKRPEKTGEEEQNHKGQISSRKNTRSQYILSFSPRMFKKLCQVSNGKAIIPSDKDLAALTED